MASSEDEIKRILQKLGNLAGNSREILTLAQGIKDNQKNLTFALQGAIKVIGALNNMQTDIRAVTDTLMDDANAAEAAYDRNSQFITQLQDILDSAPTSAEAQGVIDNLSAIVNTDRMKSKIASAIPEEPANADIRRSLNIPSSAPGASVGGYDWRTAEKKSSTRRRNRSRRRKGKRTRSKRSN